MPSRQNKIAASQLAKKLKLENKFKPVLTRFFNQLAQDINIVWASTGNIPTLSPFDPELITILRNHYRDVAKAFSGEVQKEIKHHRLQLETKQLVDEIDSDVMSYIMRHSTQQSSIILSTTQKELQTIVSGVLISSSLAETPLSQLQIGNEIRQTFINRTGGRVSTIAITETNTTAERIKYIEANAFNELIVQEGNNLIDTWNTTLDEKTRQSHVFADRQEVIHGRPFTVQGQMLRFPGDTELGASLDNVINCRCSSITTIADSEPAIATEPAIPLITRN
jgi:hypothetical protein